MSWAPQGCTAGGVLHGAALIALADSLGAVCAYLNLSGGAGTATVSSSTNLMRAVREGVISATARPLHVGKSVIVVQTELRDAAAELVGQVTQAQAVLGSQRLVGRARAGGFGRVDHPPAPRPAASPKCAQATPPVIGTANIRPYAPGI